LQQNDHHRHDGVAKHFEFASPANRAVEEEEGGVEGGENAQTGMQHQQQQQQQQEEEQEDRRPLMDLQAFAGVVYERLQPMLGCHSFSMRQLQYESPDRACFLVRTTQGKKTTAAATAGTAAAVGMGGGGHGNHQHHQHYLWLLSRQAEGQLKDCWMTDAIVSAEHGLLSFLNLPLCAEEGGGRGAGEGVDAGGVWLQQCAAGGGGGVE
jgi:N-methylhydantoinase B/oxoprolinase/acetone carboxylase alpha subunit